MVTQLFQRRASRPERRVSPEHCPQGWRRYTILPKRSTMAPANQSALDEATERVAKDIRIPPCPAVLTALLREIRADDPDFKKVASLVSSDVGLAAAMLKTVNSPFYGLQRRVESVQQALGLLGLLSTTQLVTGLLLRQAFPVGASKALEHFWEHSTRVASLTALLARELRSSDRDISHNFGLFRDCGMPIMLERFKAPYEEVVAGKMSIDAEQERFQTHHGRIGYLLAKSWSLPDDMCLAVRDHHSPAALSGEILDLSPACRNLIATGALADHFISVASGGNPLQAMDELARLATAQLGVSVEDLAELAQVAGRVAAEAPGRTG